MLIPPEATEATHSCHWKRKHWLRKHWLSDLSKRIHSWVLTDENSLMRIHWWEFTHSCLVLSYLQCSTYPEKKDKRNNFSSTHQHSAPVTVDMWFYLSRHTWDMYFTLLCCSSFYPPFINVFVSPIHSIHSIQFTQFTRRSASHHAFLLGVFTCWIITSHTMILMPWRIMTIMVIMVVLCHLLPTAEEFPFIPSPKSKSNVKYDH